MKWEYTTLEGTTHSREHGNGRLPTSDDMNDLGSRGWELAACMPGWDNDAPTLVFKRPVPPTPQVPQEDA